MSDSIATSVTLIIPIYNAAHYIESLFSAIQNQTLQPDHILVIDSSSSDNTRELLAHHSVKIHTILQSEFDHSGTRRLANEMIKSDIYIYLTQDALPANPDCFRNLIDFFNDENNKNVGCAYGKQLPHIDANPISIHARRFNYPSESIVKSFADKTKYGIKTCFNSNSFAAYRREALMNVGNFPTKMPMCEDVYMAAKMLKNNWQVAYVASSQVYHSHNLTVKEEFHRYFFIGVFYAEQSWIKTDYNSAASEGKRFVQSELAFLFKHRHFLWLPRALISTCVKYFAYQLGLHHTQLPLRIKRRWGITQSYWTE